MSEKKYFLIRWAGTWADEMDLDGFKIFDEESKIDFFNQFKNFFDEYGSYSFCVGTNEDVDYSSFTKFVNSFSIKSITKEDKDIIEKYLNLEYGFFPNSDELEYN